MLDDDSEIFGKFLEWVDSRRVNEIEGMRQWGLYVRLMAFSEKISARDFQQYLINCMVTEIAKNNRRPGSGFLPARQHIVEVYELLPVASEKLMEYLVMMFAAHPDISLDQNLPERFLVEVAVFLKHTHLELTREERLRRVMGILTRKLR